MEPLPPYEHLNFPSSDEYTTLFSSSSIPTNEQERIASLETRKTPLVSSSDSGIAQGKNIQTDTLSNNALPAPFHPAGKRLSLPSVAKTPGTPRQSQLLGNQLELLLKTTIERIETIKVPSLTRPSHPNTATNIPPAHSSSAPTSISTLPLPIPPQRRAEPLKRSTVLLLLVLASILLFRAADAANGQFIGPQGWSYVLGGPTTSNDPNLLANLNQQLHARSTQKGTSSQNEPQLTPQQYINLIISKMSLQQKLGQMMIVQFIGSQYSLQLSTMISQENVGSVLIFTANSNVQSKEQLKGLIQQMQANSQPIPMAVAIDQEGGAVDRLAKLDGPRPSESTLGATTNPDNARAAGIQDAQDLSSYGINLNLAPVVDVTRVYNAQLATRTYGSDPTLVTQMAAAYLQGLQQSGKVLGTIKHFPGLGDVAVDPHIGVPVMHQSESQMEQIDWAPYRALIQQNLAHVVMVTHEIVSAVDPTLPSTLSNKVVTGILRDDLGFQGVIMTDSLSMSGVTSYTTEYQAAADAIEAGADMVMGAASSEDVSAMYASIEQAIASGALSTSRIDNSVRRILLMKYALGLISLPTNPTSPTTGK